MTADRREARIPIEGVELTSAQSCTIRVAVAGWLADLDLVPLAMSALGAMGPLYQENLRQIQALIAKGAR